jgi:hypothetical protein
MTPTVKTQAAAADDDGDDSGGGLFWDLGTLAPSATIIAHLTVKAASTGPTQLVALATTQPNDPSCGLDDFEDLNDDGAIDLPTNLPDCVAVSSLRAIAPPVPVVRPTKPTTITAAQPQLAATGAESPTATLIALAMLLAAADAVRLGRRKA